MKRKSQRAAGFWMFTALLCWPGSAEAAQTRYFALVGHGSEVYELDASTGWSATLFCDLAIHGVDNVNAADFSADGFLFVVGGAPPQTLFKIDLWNGCAVIETWDLGATTEAIAFDDAGLLYFVSNYNQIKTFDLVTGVVEPSPVPIGTNEVQSIDFDPSDVLFAIRSVVGGDTNKLLRIALDGSGTQLCDLDAAVPDINSLDINAAGEFHALTSSPGHVYEIDSTAGPTGCATVIGDTTLSFGALASVCFSPCPGDVDGDNDVDLSDLARVLGNFGTESGAAMDEGDLDCDGDIDVTDLAIVLANFGKSCP